MSEGGSTDGDPLTVVVVDDDADLRWLACDVLERDGRFSVVGEAADGDGAVDAAATHRPNLLVLDLEMPGSDGAAALPRIHDASPDTRVVVLSAHPDADPGALLDGGAVGFLQKHGSLRSLPDELVALGGFLELVAEAIDEHRADLAGELRSAGVARRLVQEALDRWNCTELLDTVTLLVSELVTNAVVHGEAEESVEVTVQLLPETVRIGVVDSDPRLPRVRRVEPTATSGRGLALVEDLSLGWGASAHRGGKTVWFDVARPDADAP